MNFKNPLTVFALGLTVFALTAIFYNWRPEVWWLSASLLLGGGIGYRLLVCWQPKPRHLKANALISGLIVLLLLIPPFEINLVSFLWIALGPLLVMLAKGGPRYKKQLIFNPVALGLLIFMFLLTVIYGQEAILPTFVAWWGTAFAGAYALIPLLPLVLYATYKFRKFYLVGTFLLGNAVWLMVTEGWEALAPVYLSGTIYFLVGVMMLEPKTSPVKISWQIGAALGALFVYRLVGSFGVANSALWAVIMVNIVHLLSRLKLRRL